MQRGTEIKAGQGIVKIVLLLVVLIFVVWLFFFGGLYSITGMNF